MYSFYYFGFNPEIMQANSWFIYSTSNNNILCLVRELLYSYWKDHTRVVNYFVFHLFMTMALEFYKDDYQKMPIVSQANSHILATYIYDDFNQIKYDILKSCVGFHKLSIRFDPEKLGRKGSFYDVVIRQGE